MRKILFALSILIAASINFVFAEEIKDEMYYKRQIQNQRFLYSNTGFFGAVQKGNKVAVDAFLKTGMNPNLKWSGSPVAMHALFLDKNEVFDMLLKAGANPETKVPALWVAAKPQNLLSFSIKRKNIEAVQSLIENGVDVNKEFNKKTPLNYAIKEKQIKIAEMLLKAGAKVDNKTKILVEKSKDDYLKDLISEYAAK